MNGRERRRKGGSGKRGLERLRENGRRLVVCASVLWLEAVSPSRTAFLRLGSKQHKLLKDTAFPRERERGD